MFLYSQSWTSKYFFPSWKLQKVEATVQVMCDKCHGFFRKSCCSRHGKLCMLNFEVRLQALSSHFQKKEPADYDSYPDDFKSCIVGTMLNDEIGKISQVDKMTLLFGSRLFDRSKRKLDMIGEVQQFIRMEMRKLGWLLGLGLGLGLQLLNEKKICTLNIKMG